MKSKFIIKLFIFIFIPLCIKATERVRLKTQFLFPSKMMESIGTLKVLNLNIGKQWVVSSYRQQSHCPAF